MCLPLKGKAQKIVGQNRTHSKNGILFKNIFFSGPNILILNFKVATVTPGNNWRCKPYIQITKQDDSSCGEEETKQAGSQCFAKRIRAKWSLYSNLAAIAQSLLEHVLQMESGVLVMRQYQHRTHTEGM